MTMHAGSLAEVLNKHPAHLVFLENRNGGTHRIEDVSVKRMRLRDDGTHRLIDEGDPDDDEDFEDSVIQDCVVIKLDEKGE